jgi:hypothetical protein
LSPDQRESIQASLKNAGIEVEYLILGADGRTPVRTDTVGYLEWCLDKVDDRIAAQIALEEIGDIRVSTIFLSSIIIGGHDSMAKRPFETMVFENGRDMGMTRKYATFDEAEIGHKEVVAEVIFLAPRSPGL